MRRRSSEKSTEAAKTEEKPVVDVRSDAPRPPDAEAPPVTESSKLEMPGGFGRIVTHMFSVVSDEEIMDEYHFLRSKLAFEGRASEKQYAELQNELDEAEENVQRAAHLHARARLAHVAFESDAQAILSSLRAPAKKALEDRKVELFKTEGVKGKVISNDDILSEVAQMFPDEWASLTTRRKSAELAVELIGELKAQLSARAWDLRTMVARSREVQ